MLLGDLDLEEHFAAIEDEDLGDTQIESEDNVNNKAYGDSSAEVELYAIAVDAERERSASRERTDEINAASELEIEEERHARLGKEDEARLDESYLSETTDYLCDSFVMHATEGAAEEADISWDPATGTPPSTDDDILDKTVPEHILETKMAELKADSDNEKSECKTGDGGNYGR